MSAPRYTELFPQYLSLIQRAKDAVAYIQSSNADMPNLDRVVRILDGLDFTAKNHYDACTMALYNLKGVVIHLHHIINLVNHIRDGLPLQQMEMDDLSDETFHLYRIEIIQARSLLLESKYNTPNIPKKWRTIRNNINY